MWHIRLVAATEGRLIKSPRFSDLSSNTNLTFYCNCSNVPFTISTSPSDCLLASAPLKAHIAPRGAVPPPLKTTSLAGHGPKDGSRPGWLIIVSTGHWGPVLYLLLIVNGAPFCPIKPNNTMDNAVQNRQWISISRKCWPDDDFFLGWVLGDNNDCTLCNVKS